MDKALSLDTFDFSQIETKGDPMKAALLKLEAARRELKKGPSYGRAVEVQLAENEVHKLASIARREIKVL